MRSHYLSLAPGNRTFIHSMAANNAPQRALTSAGSTLISSGMPAETKAGRRGTTLSADQLAKRQSIRRHRAALITHAFVIAFIATLGHAAWAQTKLPVLRASSPTLSIREGDSFYQQVWTISPKDRPDVFTTNPFTGQQRVVFYSDRDSLAVVMRPGRTYDFVVLLNATDSAYTRISTRPDIKPTLKPKLVFTSSQHAGGGTDTVRFRADKYGLIHLQGRINGSDTLDFLFDTGAGAVVVTASLLGTRVQAKLDGRVNNVGVDGGSQVQTSSGNTVSIGPLTWPNTSLLAIDYKSFPFDAVLG